MNIIFDRLKKFRVKYNLPPYFLIIIFCTILVLTNILCQWQYSFMGFTIVYGLFTYPLTFLITDVVSEIYGKTSCRKLVLIGLIFATIPSLYLSTLQITIGSMLAYILSQTHDVWSFHWWRKFTNGKHLWLRNNASTIVSQLIDTVVFTSVAFYGVLEADVIFSIMYTEYPIKIAYALIDTILLYLVIGIYKNKSIEAS